MRLLFAICLSFIALVAVSQENIESASANPDYESLTLSLYNQQKWDSLLITGEAAIGAGYDYFYIRVRTGVAAFYKENYSLAAYHLEQARKQNSVDDFANEMLFYCYSYTGRSQQAAFLIRNMTSASQKRIKKNLPGSIFYIEAGPVFTSNEESVDNFMKTEADSNEFTEKYTEQSAIYFLAGWKQSFGSRLSVNAAVSYLELSKNREVNINYTEPFYSFTDSVSGDFKVSQIEYYISPSITLSNRFIVSPAVRIAKTNITEPIVSTEQITNLYLGNPISRKYNNRVAGGELVYARNYWKASAGVWHLNINQTKTLQLSSTIMFLPFGNMNLYSITGASWKTERSTRPIIATQTIGYKICNKTWLELSATAGNLAGTVEHNGQLLNNQINNSDYRLTSMLLFDLSPKLRITLRYQYLKNEATVYIIDKAATLQQQNYNYNKHIITGGITWNVL